MRALIVLVLLWVAVEFAGEMISSRRNGPSTDQIQAVLRSWPDGPRHTALGLIARFGTPQGVRRDAVWWDDRGESRIVVYRTARQNTPLAASGRAAQ